MKNNNQIHGFSYWPAQYYHNRYECEFWGRHGLLIRKWIRDNWGDIDDLVWSSGESFEGWEYTAMITPEQLTYVLLRWG